MYILEENISDNTWTQKNVNTRIFVTTILHCEEETNQEN